MHIGLQVKIQIQFCGCLTMFYSAKTLLISPLILLYVNDMIINVNDIAIIHAFQHFLRLNFEMKDLGTLRYILP